MRDQRIRDPIHNLIKFSSNSQDDEILWHLLQTPPLQRLRRVKQLGFSDFVYPGASHTRFSHSVGAMQMARRMLDILRLNKVLTQNEDSPLWHRATLCAALLHDVGHGPYSHAFEEVSKELNIKTRHEEYTSQIIDGTEINDLLSGSSTPALSGSSKELLEATLSILKTDPGETQYSRVISSQLDADRLDFLMRDRHFTGVRFGEIDLEWIFDSLTIEKMPVELGSDIEQWTFVVSEKGRVVVEGYLAAYAYMYKNVYFHKTTRGVEAMVKKILAEVFLDENVKDKLPADDRLLIYFSEAPEPPINYFMALDDSAILSLVSSIASGGFGKASELAKRFLRRDLFKCFEPPKQPKDDPPSKKIKEFMELMNKEGLSYMKDMPSSKGYKQFEITDENFINNVLVRSPIDDEPKSIGTLNPAVVHFADKPTIRFYYDDSHQREQARTLWDSL